MRNADGGKMSEIARGSDNDGGEREGWPGENDGEKSGRKKRMVEEVLGTYTAAFLREFLNSRATVPGRGYVVGLLMASSP